MIKETAELQVFRQQGVAAIEQVSFMQLQELISFHHPPPVILNVLLAVQTVLAGHFSVITLNPASNQVATSDWNACRKMACMDSRNFLKACVSLFDKFNCDSYLDARVQAAAMQVKQGELNLQKVQNCSTACGQLLIWLENVINYWQAWRKQT